MRTNWRLYCDGPVVPYVRTTQRQKWVDPRYKRYQAWKSMLKMLAIQARFPDALDPDKSYSIRVVVSWENKARADLDNLVKGVMDALFRQDRRIMEIVAVALEHCEKEKIEVELHTGE